MEIPLTPEIEECLERFYFNAYCNVRSQASSVKRDQARS
jgi:hypothetical protein